MSRSRISVVRGHEDTRQSANAPCDPSPTFVPAAVDRMLRASAVSCIAVPPFRDASMLCSGRSRKSGSGPRS